MTSPIVSTLPPKAVPNSASNWPDQSTVPAKRTEGGLDRCGRRLRAASTAASLRKRLFERAGLLGRAALDPRTHLVARLGGTVLRALASVPPFAREAQEHL